MSYELLALVPRPAESICAEEIAACSDATHIRTAPGAVRFAGSLETLYRVNLWSRCAMRVVWVLQEAPCPHAEALYALAHEIPWHHWITPKDTLAVRVHGQLPIASHSHYLGQRVKDAVVDALRARLGNRPSVEVQKPTFAIHVQLYTHNHESFACIGLDSSGAPLFQRGYRQGTGEAPLKETLAATLLRMAKYPALPHNTPVIDPLCGSGTFLLEAAGMALQRAPGLHRSFAFEQWPMFSKDAWEELRTEALHQARIAIQPFLFGADENARVLQDAQQSARAAQVETAIHFAQQALQNATPPADVAEGLLICNPPYGHRMGEESQLVPLYRTLGDVLKRRFPGWTAYVFTANLTLAKQIGLRPNERHVLYNGPLEGRLLRFNLWQGTL